MSSDGAGGGTGTGPLSRLAGLLAEASGGDRPAPRELAELLWLAGHIKTVEEEGEGGEEEHDRPPHPPPAQPPVPESPPAREDTPAPPPPITPAVPPRIPLHLPAPGGGTGPRHTALLAPAPPMLRHPLGLQRAVRPLKRWAEAPLGRELDERATAERIARLDTGPEWWLPVLRPARERWLRLHLVHDTGPTMPIWRPLVRELHLALAQSGVFRTVTLHPAGPDGTVRGQAAHAPADGRTVTLLISDCMGPQWRKGRAADRWYGTLRRWARRMPLAVIQPLPEHLWRDTALPTTPGRLSAPHPAAPTATLTFTPYEPPYDVAQNPPPDEGAFPLPVLEPEPGWLANWAALVAAPGGTEYPAAVALLGHIAPDAADRTDVTRLSASELVLRFRSTASPEAFRLAGHVALGRPVLPVMRLVQAAVEPDPRPQHLAEVILSGMLTAVPGRPGTYAFRPGVRDLLLRGLPRSDRGRTTELLERVGGLIDSRAGRAPGEFTATAPSPGGAATTTGADGEAFARVSAGSVRQLAGLVEPAPEPQPLAAAVTKAEPPVSEPSGGSSEALPERLRRRYRPIPRLGATESLWQTEDTEKRRRVTLRPHSGTGELAQIQTFARDAGVLKELRHENLTAVLDFGIEDLIPYVVMEQVEGLGLNTLAAPNGYRLPPPLLVRIGAGLAGALAALHSAGLTHGRLGMSQVILLPDGTTKLSPYQSGWISNPSEGSQDLRALAELMFQLASGTAQLRPSVASDSLVHLPADLRETYADALTRLLSPSQSVQAQGLDLLGSTDMVEAAVAKYTRRSHHLLGPLRVAHAGDATLDVPSDLQPMLAMLLLKHGRTVTHDELRWGIWGPADEPRNALGVIGRMASRLRTLLGPAAALATHPGGYALHTSADYLDIAHCDDLAQQAEWNRAFGDFVRAHREIAEALNLWRPGTELEGVTGPAAQTARTRLSQLRLGLLRTRAELDLDLGRVDQAAAGLASLVRSHPSREDFRHLYISTLRRQGRGGDALEVFEEYELQGGQSPELLALGHELREELDAGRAERDDGDEDTVTGHEPFEPDEQPLPHDNELIADDPVEPIPGPLIFEFADDGQDADTHALLGRAITRLVAASGHSPDQFPLRTHAEGFSLPCGPGSPVPDLLRIAIDRFEGLLRELGGARLCLAHGVGPDELAQAHRLLDTTGAHGVIALPRTIREQVGAGEGPIVHTLKRDIPPLPALRGPFPVPPLLPEPRGVSRTVYHAPAGYYEIDLTEHRTELAEEVRTPSGGTLSARGVAVWRITRPDLAARRGGGDFDQFLRSHLARRLPPVARRPAPTTGDLTGALQQSDFLAGRSVRWDVALWDAGSLDVATAALRAADAVIIGFEGTLTRIYDTQERIEAVRELTRLLTELRNPDDALAGRPLPRADVLHTHDSRPHPADLLYSFHETPHAEDLHRRAAEIEVAAVRRAIASPGPPPPVRRLTDSGLHLAVVTDMVTHAARNYLQHFGLLDLFSGGVHGREDSRIQPTPSDAILRRAIAQLGIRPHQCLVIGSSPAEKRAAQSAGAAYLDTGLATLLEAARTL
ncbi:SAV_2336 N-terminal domain-related protein [Streptomyces sp. NPDC059477]|uniref:SAV_2336 N-terminal domain-related protein n=1 Tax=Streptomyces sp. NPDC059477 TaxID=3346847 RepID=UPI0036A512EE